MDDVSNISAQLAQLLRKMADALQPDVAPAVAVPSSAPSVPVAEAPALVILRQRYPAAPEAWLQALAERSVALPAHGPVVPVVPVRDVPEPPSFPEQEKQAEAVVPDFPSPKRSARPRPVFTRPEKKAVAQVEFAEPVPGDAPLAHFPQPVQRRRAGPDYTEETQRTSPDPSDWPVVADQPEAGGPVFPARLTNPKREHSFPEPAPRLAEPAEWPTHVPKPASPPQFPHVAVKDRALPVYAERVERKAPLLISEHERPDWPAAPESAVATLGASVALTRSERFAAARPEQEARQWSA